MVNLLVTASNGRLAVQQHKKNKREARLKFTSTDKMDEDSITFLCTSLNFQVSKILLPGVDESISRKYKTWIITHDTTTYKIVFVGGLFGNKGLNREMEIANDMRDSLNNNNFHSLLTSLSAAGAFDVGDIPISIKHQPGKTIARPVSLHPENVGEQISDITIETSEGKNIFVSLKTSNEVTFVNLGISGVFAGDGVKIICNRDTKHAELLESFGVDVQLVADGVNDYFDKVSTNAQHIVKCPIVDTDKILKYVRSGFGYGYWYARERSKDDFSIKDLTTLEKRENFIKEIKVIEIRYPYYIDNKKSSKQCDIVMEAKGEIGTRRIVAQIRNASGGHIPKQFNMLIRRKKY